MDTKTIGQNVFMKLNVHMISKIHNAEIYKLLMENVPWYLVIIILTRWSDNLTNKKTSGLFGYPM